MGWGYANMWYDKYPGVPPRGSLLETVFVLVGIQRRQAELLSTRALVQAIVGLHALSPNPKETMHPAIEAFQLYADKMFPFLDKATTAEKTDQHKALEHFTKAPLRISTKDIYKQKVEHARRNAALRSTKLKPRIPGSR